MMRMEEPGDPMHIPEPSPAAQPGKPTLSHGYSQGVESTHALTEGKPLLKPLWTQDKMTAEFPYPYCRDHISWTNPRELGVPWPPPQGVNGTGSAGREPTGQSAHVGRTPQGKPPMSEGGSWAPSWGTGAYAGRLPQALEEPLGRDEELEQAAEPIPLVAGLQQPKHLAQDGGSSGFEGRVEGLESTLHGRIQRPGILREGGECHWWDSGPAEGTPDPVPLPTIPRCAVPLSGPWDAHTGYAAVLRSSKASCAGTASRHSGSALQHRAVVKEPGISPEAAAMRRWTSRSSRRVKRSQSRQIVGLCRDPQLAVGMQQMGGRTNI